MHTQHHAIAIIDVFSSITGTCATPHAVGGYQKLTERQPQELATQVANWSLYNERCITLSLLLP